jgi:predicted HTH domain antitoxin
MRPFAIALPDSITEVEAKFYLALKLYEVGRLSCGEAAELAGYSKRTFLELIGKSGASAFDYPADEFASDRKNARRTDGHQQ